MKTFGQTIRERRKELKITLVELGKIVDVTQGYLSNIENDIRVPAPKVIKKLAEALDMNYQYLMTVGGIIEEKTFGQKLLEHVDEVDDREGALQRLSDVTGLDRLEIDGIFKGSYIPEPETLRLIADALGNVSYGQLLQEAGYELEAQQESMKQLLLDFGSSNMARYYERSLLLEEVLDLKDLLEGSRKDFYEEDLRPFYNGHLLTDNDRKRLAAIIKEVFPEYEEPGDDHENYKKRWNTDTDIE